MKVCTNRTLRMKTDFKSVLKTFRLSTAFVYLELWAFSSHPSVHIISEVELYEVLVRPNPISHIYPYPFPLALRTESQGAAVEINPHEMIQEHIESKVAFTWADVLCSCQIFNMPSSAVVTLFVLLFYVIICDWKNNIKIHKNACLSCTR